MADRDEFGRFIKGHTFSEGTRLKMSRSHEGCVPWNKGVACSEETKRKLSLSLKGHIPWNRGLKGGMAWNKGKKGCFSQETIRKMSDAHKDKPAHKQSEETKRWLSEYAKATGRKPPGCKNWIGCTGEKSPVWKGGAKASWARARHKRKNRGFVLLTKNNPYNEPIEYHHIHPDLPYVVPCPARIHQMFPGSEKTHHQNVNAMLGFKFDYFPGNKLSTCPKAHQ